MRVGFKLAEKARYEGRVEEGRLAYGQTAGMINSIRPAGQIVHDVMAEAAEVQISRFDRPWPPARAEGPSEISCDEAQMETFAAASVSILRLALKRRGISMQLQFRMSCRKCRTWSASQATADGASRRPGQRSDALRFTLKI